MSGSQRVLSIQSHVVRGYVGNKSATFPLQVLGYEVDPINSVQFCTHTQYAHWTGQTLGRDDLIDLYDGLEKNDLVTGYSHLLTGYIGEESFLRETVNVAKKLKSKNPKLVYVCDPVMGDNGQFYVNENLLPIYRDEVIPVADVVVPNQFEIESLTGVKIATVDDAIRAMKLIHDKGPHTVVISSTDLGDKDSLVMLASCRKGYGNYEVLQQKIPVLGARFVGTGDLFAALLLAWLEKTELKEACHKVISTMQHVLIKTFKAAQELAGEGNTPTPSQLELHIIQSMRDIENPTLQVPRPQVL